MASPIHITGSTEGRFGAILSDEALHFIATLHRTFEPTRQALLRRRIVRQYEIDEGKLPDFLPETRNVREDPSWRGAPPAPGLVDRRVEITGPTDRKMVINALNADVKTYMADFEDSSAPTWENMLSGQVNLFDAVRRNISMTIGDKKYQLRSDREPPTLIVRPRGWHMVEKHCIVDGAPISASIFDFGLFFFHNAKYLVDNGRGPYFYLPKMESHLEARLWNDIFNVSQDMIGLPRGTIRATVLIETILAAFEMEEIIYELRAHSAGLNCGRWDYIFSVIKKFRNNKSFVLPDRGSVTMTVPFMQAYVDLLVKTCHKRGVHAMGGMAAQIPIKNDVAANNAAMQRVYSDKLREVTAGHDGTWVAHPALAKIANDVFDKHMPTPNQLFHPGNSSAVAANDLLNMNVPGVVTEAGVRANIEIALGYMEAWLRGLGCIPINYLMEDAATAEVSRSQLWQWSKHKVSTAEGKVVDSTYVLGVLQDVTKSLSAKASSNNKFDLASRYLAKQIVGAEYAEFITTLLYDNLASSTDTSKL